MSWSASGTGAILRLLPTIMMAEPTSRPHAWMLSEYFSQLLLMSESESIDEAQSTRILGELMSSKRPRAPTDTSSRIATRISGDAPAPMKTVRGTWVLLSDGSRAPDEITVAIESVVAQNKPADIVSMPIGHVVPDVSPPSQSEEESSNLRIATAAELRHPVGSFSRGINSRRPRAELRYPVGSVSRGTISRRPRIMIEDRVASYRLTKKIIQEQLSRMFPEIPVAEFEIKVG